jgi:Phosphoribosyl transferase domain
VSHGRAAVRPRAGVWQLRIGFARTDPPAEVRARSSGGGGARPHAGRSYSGARGGVQHRHRRTGPVACLEVAATGVQSGRRDRESRSETIEERALALERRRTRAAQAHRITDRSDASAAARKHSGAFCVKQAEKLRDCDVVLVDDVFTTGTTVSECARVLRRGGAARVFVATVARVLKAEVTFANVPEELEPEQAIAIGAGT